MICKRVWALLLGLRSSSNSIALHHWRSPDGNLENAPDYDAYQDYYKYD